MVEGDDMENFKSLKYETKNTDEKKQIKDMLMSKLGKQKYSLHHLAQKNPNELLQVIKSR